MIYMCVCVFAVFMMIIIRVHDITTITIANDRVTIYDSFSYCSGRLRLKRWFGTNPLIQHMAGARRHRSPEVLGVKPTVARRLCRCETETERGGERTSQSGIYRLDT